ncbi:MAG: phosphodiester glycosidase family protein [Cyanobacteria bacterium P01_D01_bin.1]
MTNLLRRWMKKRKEVLVWIGLLLPLAFYACSILTRPTGNINNQPLFEGITYSRYIRQIPRPQLIHLLEIDLGAPGVVPFVTPGVGEAKATEQYETIAQKTSGFLKTHQLQLAINANFFYPFEEATPWQYYPHEGDPTNLSGLAISNGEVVSSRGKHTPALCFLEGRAEINEDGFCPPDARQAVAGLQLSLADRPPPDTKTSYKFYPVCIAALDAEGTTLWLLLVDGKQPLYSEGMTRPEAADFLRDLGAQRAVQLDGGGSTTLAIAADDKAKILNAVIHAKVPGNERTVANHLGFFANPLEEK